MAGRSMAILYGTETGNSEELAGELGKMAERLHFDTVVDEMNRFNLVRVWPVQSSWRVYITGQGALRSQDVNSCPRKIFCNSL